MKDEVSLHERIKSAIAPALSRPDMIQKVLLLTASRLAVEGFPHIVHSEDADRALVVHLTRETLDFWRVALAAFGRGDSN